MNFRIKIAGHNLTNGGVTDMSDILIIQSWIKAVTQPKNSKREYLFLLRRTLLLILSPKWIQSSVQQDMIFVFKHHYKIFPSIVRNCTEIHNALLKILIDPWSNEYFQWDDLYRGKLTIEDKCVQDYFRSEPEEVVLARVDYLVNRCGQRFEALTLCKLSFLYHYRVTKHAVFYSKPPCEKDNFTEVKSPLGHASLDWIIDFVSKFRSAVQLNKELEQFVCHEGVEMIGRARESPRHEKFSHILITLFLVRDLTTNPTQYCCTKKLYVLFCMMHKDLNSGPKEIAASAGALLAKLAPSSSHLYLFVDAAHEQFGIRCIELYVEFYVRGFTSDLNSLEIARQAGASEEVHYWESRIAFCFTKLASLFSNFHEEASRECVFSAFSLQPSEERLHTLQRLTHSLNNANDIRLNFTSSKDSLLLKDNPHGQKSDGSYVKNKRFDSLHPLLNKGIRNIAYNLTKDFVSVLDSARCITFQYNIFNWQDKFYELRDYLVVYNLKRPALKDSGSDTEVGSDGSTKSDSDEGESNTSSVLVKKVVPPIKRKRGPISKQAFPLDVGANIEVESNDYANKRRKIQISLEATHSPITPENKTLGGSMHSAIENVIRKTLNDNISKGQSVIYSLPGNYCQSNNSAPSPILTETSKINENSSLCTHPKQIDPVPEQSHPLASGNKNTVLNERPCDLNTDNQVPSVSGISKYNITRQSVVVTPVSNSSQRTGFPPNQDSSKLPHVHERFSVGVDYCLPKASNFKGMEGSKNNHGALNLSSSKSNSEKQKHFKNYYSKASVFAPSKPVDPAPRSPKYEFTYPPLKKTNISVFYDQKRPILNDRNSVIQHTTQHINQKTWPSNQRSVSVDSSQLLHANERSSPISNQLSVSADSSAMLARNSRKDTSSPFQINVSMLNHPVSSHSVITRKPSPAGVSIDDKSSLNRYNTASLTKKVPPLSPSVSSIVLPSWGNVLPQNTGTKTAAITDISPSHRNPKPYEPNSIKVSISLSKPAPVVSESFAVSNQQWTTSSASFANNQHMKTASGIAEDSQWLRSSVPSNMIYAINSKLAQCFQKRNSPTTVSSPPWYVSPYPKVTTSSKISLPQPSFASSTKFPVSSGDMQKARQSGQAIDNRKKQFVSKAPVLSNSDDLHPQALSELLFWKSRLSPMNNSVTSDSSSKMDAGFMAGETSPFVTVPKQNSRHFSDMPANLSSATTSNSSSLLCDRLVKSSPSHYLSNARNDSVSPRDGRRVVVLQTTNSASTSSYTHAQSDGGSLTKTCCSPMEVTPCQSCSSVNEIKAYHAPKQLGDRESNSLQAINLTNSRCWRRT